MTAYDPLRLPEGGRSIACELCEAQVPLALDNPRRVCAACGNVNLPTPEVEAQAPASPLRFPFSRGGLQAAQPTSTRAPRFAALRRARSRQSPRFVATWIAIGGASVLGPIVLALLSRSLVGFLGVHPLLGAAACAGAALFVAALTPPPAGVHRGWRVAWLGLGWLGGVTVTTIGVALFFLASLLSWLYGR